MGILEVTRWAPPGAGGWFDEMWQAHQGFLLAYASRRLPSREAAEEAVAEAFTTAWLHRRQVPEEPATRLWLTRAAFHAVSNLRRKSDRQRLLLRRLSSEPAATSTAWPDSSDTTVDRLRAALAALPEQDRELVQLAMWEGLTHNDIAKVLDISAGNVAVRLHRVRQRLRKEITPATGTTAGDLTALPVHGDGPRAPTRPIFTAPAPITPTRRSP